MKYTFDYSIGRLARQIVGSIGPILNKKFKDAGFDFDSREWMYISFIQNIKGISQNELGKEIGFNKVMINRGIEKLEKQGVVIREKDANDKRVNRLKLTTQGKAIYKKLKSIVENTMDKIFENIPVEDKQQCMVTLEKVLLNMSVIRDN